MKHLFMTIVALSFILLNSCQKQNLIETNSSLSDVKNHATFLNSVENFDVYVDDAGNKLFIPNQTKTGHNGSVLTGSGCTEELQLVITGGSHYYVCHNIGSSCKNIIYEGEHVIIVCNTAQF
ncbi:MAG: hypothetical protein JXL97_05095 [Bacteroidales bacterium]|nr:hypothetical protein [Bacteroidales bacterium]